MADRVYYYEQDAAKKMESLSRYRFSLPLLKDRNVLDIGCGARMGPMVISEAADKVTAVDISKEAIQYCLKKWPSEKINYKVCDVVSMPFENESFDAVLAFEVVEHIPDQEMFLETVYKVLKKNGICVISTPNKIVMSPDGIYSNTDHTREFTALEFETFLHAKFNDVELYGQLPSEKVKKMEESRKQSYDQIARVPVLFRRFLPKAIRQNLFRGYFNLFSKFKDNITENSITEADFPVKNMNMDEAGYMLAVCRKK